MHWSPKQKKRGREQGKDEREEKRRRKGKLAKQKEREVWMRSRM